MMGGRGSGRHRTKTKAEPLGRDRDLWDRQDREGPKAWEAFVLYRDQGNDRSLAHVVDTLGKSMALISRWSAQWSWRKRVADLERAQDKARTSGAMEGLKDMGRRHIRQSRELQDFMAGQLTKLKREAAKSKQAIVPAKTVLQTFERMAKVDRLVRDQSTENTANGPNLDLSKLTREQLKQLQHLQAMATPDDPGAQDDT